MTQDLPSQHPITEDKKMVFSSKTPICSGLVNGDICHVRPSLFCKSSQNVLVARTGEVILAVPSRMLEELPC